MKTDKINIAKMATIISICLVFVTGFRWTAAVEKDVQNNSEDVDRCIESIEEIKTEISDLDVMGMRLSGIERNQQKILEKLDK